MLWVANFPIFVIFFFGVFAYFLLRMFAAGSRSETREIFEFYLTSNEILRDDDRRWYGFEINEAIGRGEEILRRMSAAPPLVHFALGALQNKAGNHKAAVANLAFVVENTASDEAAYAFPTPELRNYVKVLRKIERDPADAPLTSAAVRALERARKIRAKVILEDSRQKFSAIPVAPEQPVPAKLDGGERRGYAYEAGENGHALQSVVPSVEASPGTSANPNPMTESNGTKPPKRGRKEKPDPFANRKPISEVLHDIYDKNVQ